jgi:nucleoside-diphosphate-sugar epimerase
MGSPSILVLGASGLIGNGLALSLADAGFTVIPLARRFTAAQRAAWGTASGVAAVEMPIVGVGESAIAKLLAERQVDIVVNCIGVLQDSGHDGTESVHETFVRDLIGALRICGRPCLLLHLSIPGHDDEDRTAFSLSKRVGERIVAASGLPFVILRPGFVVAAAAYGGSALIRALAASIFTVPDGLAKRPFAVTDVADIGASIAFAARRWQDGERQWHGTWNVIQRHPASVAEVIDAFRRHFGGPRAMFAAPDRLMTFTTRAGDLVSSLGWRPPVRSTALAEMRRGVSGDPEPWIAATGIEPASLEKAVARLPATVQERWFARLYLLKPIVFGGLAIFWAASGLIALTVAFSAASVILTRHGFSPIFSRAITAASSVADILVGIAIAFRSSARLGLIVGIGLSIFYMASAALLTPALWIEPLGSLVKTVPAIILMLVALAMLDER